MLFRSEEKPEPTHKCTKCKFTGQSYDFDWTWKDANGNDLEEPNKQCPYCESPIELTEVGIAKEKEDAEWRAQWDAENEEEAVPCYSCEAEYKESELITMEGQYICPSCGEGWVMPDDRYEELDEEVLPLEEALQNSTKELGEWPFPKDKPKEGNHD